jgi:hypothetical protein
MLIFRILIRNFIIRTNMENITHEKSIYTLAQPVWYSSAGLDKGLQHDRQHLGIILAAGQTLRIRQTNPMFKDSLTLRLLNDDSNTEASFIIGKTWTEVRATNVSVPFIDTPYTDGEPQISFTCAEGTKILPVYCEGDDATVFLHCWESQEAEFGLIEAEYNRLFIPKANLTDLQSPDPFKNIDKLLAYYRRIFSFYNALSGLSFDTRHITDRNSKSRYFMKADKNGVGAGYYSSFWTAESNNSISSFWLTADDSNWGSLHEIAHGFQGGFMSDRYFSTSEVWNNIYAACYQDQYLAARLYAESWLYDYGNKTEVEHQIINNINNSLPLNQWALRSKLYFIMLMLHKIGKSAFTYFNQQYRKNCNNSNFVAADHLLLDMLSDSFAQTAENFDVTPFILLAGGYVSQRQQNINRYSNRKALYPLYQLVDCTLLEKIQTQLNLKSLLELVDPSSLRVTGLRGNVKLNIEIDDFTQIHNTEFMLMDGSNCVYKNRITQPNITLTQIPIGVYSLILPTGRDQKYQPTLGYLVVRQGEDFANIKFIRKKASPLISQEIKLLGLSDNVFATILVDQPQGKLLVDVLTTTPHYYFENITYAKIIIRNAKGKVIFTKDIQGTNAHLSHDEFIFNDGDQIEIFHAEPNRLILSPSYPSVINTKVKTNVLTITRNGLKNTVSVIEPEQPLIVRILNEVTFLRQFPQVYAKASSPFKDDIYMAINSLNKSLREKFLHIYQDCIPTDNNPTDDNIGSNFTIAAKGIGDFQFLTANICLQQQTVTIRLEAGIAHNYFSNRYASIALEDAKGNILFQIEIIGDQAQQPRTATIPLSGDGGELLRLHHEEADTRLIITNDNRGVRLIEKGKQQNYCITTAGLQRIAN